VWLVRHWYLWERQVFQIAFVNKRKTYLMPDTLCHKRYCFEVIKVNFMNLSYLLVRESISLPIAVCTQNYHRCHSLGAKAWERRMSIKEIGQHNIGIVFVWRRFQFHKPINIWTPFLW
jgi:hypothetical protein